MTASEREKPAYETVIDVTAEQVARVYAIAFMDVTAKAPDAASLIEQVSSLASILEDAPQLEEVFRSTLIPQEEKEGMLDRVFAERVSPVVLNFLKVLSRHGRLDLLRIIARLVVQIDRERRGLTDVEVRVARELAGDIQTVIHDRIRRALGTE